MAKIVTRRIRHDMYSKKQKNKYHHQKVFAIQLLLNLALTGALLFNLFSNSFGSTMSLFQHAEPLLLLNIVPLKHIHTCAMEKPCQHARHNIINAGSGIQSGAKRVVLIIQLRENVMHDKFLFRAKQCGGRIEQKQTASQDKCFVCGSLLS